MHQLGTRVGLRERGSVTQKGMPVRGQIWGYCFVPYGVIHRFWHIRGKIDDQIVYRYRSGHSWSWVYECKDERAWDELTEQGELVCVEDEEVS